MYFLVYFLYNRLNKTNKCLNLKEIIMENTIKITKFKSPMKLLEIGFKGRRLEENMYIESIGGLFPGSLNQEISVNGDKFIFRGFRNKERYDNAILEDMAGQRFYCTFDDIIDDIRAISAKNRK